VETACKNQAYFIKQVLVQKIFLYLIKQDVGFKKLKTQNQPDIRIDRCENAFLQKPTASNRDQG
jgi:hypothetical protein